MARADLGVVISRMPATHRERQAVRLASAIATKHGAAVTQENVLRDSSFVTVQLSSTLLARVRFGERARVQRELIVMRFLADRNAPVVRPSAELPPGPHDGTNTVVTFWEFEKPIRGSVDKPAAFRSLKACHDALAFYRGRLPSFLDEVRRCRRMLDAGHARRHMKTADNEFLMKMLPVLLRELRRYSLREVALHGDCHLGNAVQTKRGVVWCDFESACRGPIEWDLTCLPSKAAALYDVDDRVLKLLHGLRSWVVAGWCWMLYDRSPEKREAAMYHLGRLKAECQENCQ